MRRMLATGVSVVLMTATIGLTPTPVSAATGPYTLPFYSPNIGVTQGFGCTGVPQEPPYGTCAHYHQAIDYATTTGPVVASMAGKVIDLKEDSANGTSCGQGANYVLIDHLNGQYTVYVHVGKNTVIPVLNENVFAGERIATSGNTGCVTGAHLHYELSTSANWLNPANAINPSGHWTTDPGRVPWLAGYVSEHSPAGYTKLQYTTWTTWVQVRNDGGRPWSQTNNAKGQGRVWLGAVTSSGGSARISPFYVAGNWINNTNTGVADTNNVGINQTVRFTFNLYASPSGGSFTEYFNLGAEGMTYFNYAHFGNYYIPISVTHCC